MYSQFKASREGNCEENMASKKHWAEEFEGVADRKTKFGGDINIIVKSGKEIESKIGVYACDADSFDVFRDVFDSAMEKVLESTKEPENSEDKPVNELAKLVNELEQTQTEETSLAENIVSSRVRLARNLPDFPFASLISKEQRLELEKRVSDCLEKLSEGDENSEYAGKYNKLGEINKDEWKEQGIDRYLFENTDRYQTVADMYRDWPSGRGVFLSDNRSIIIWLNEEDHLRVQCMEKHHDLRKVFGKVFAVLGHLEKSMEFGCHDKFGWLTSCPTNLGIGMRASVHVNLGKIKEKFTIEQLKEFCAAHSMEVRGVGGENTGYAGDIFDISNKKRTYATKPADAIEDVVSGVTKLVMLNNSL